MRRDYITPHLKIKMTKEFILKKAMEQSAVDSHCLPERFLADENTVVVSEADPRARIYLELPFICDLTYYGSGIVASVSEPLTEKIKGFLTRYSAEHCFEPPAIYDLNGILSEYGAKVCYIAEYFLPDPIKMKEAESFCEPRAFVRWKSSKKRTLAICIAKNGATPYVPLVNLRMKLRSPLMWTAKSPPLPERRATAKKCGRSASMCERNSEG